MNKSTMKKLISFSNYYSKLSWNEKIVIEDLFERDDNTYNGSIGEYSRDLEMDPSNARKAILSLCEKKIIDVDFIKKISKKSMKRYNVMTSCSLSEEWINSTVTSFLK